MPVEPLAGSGSCSASPGCWRGAAVFWWREQLAKATVRDRERWRRWLRPYGAIEREDRVDGEAFVTGLVGGGWMLISLVVLIAGVRSLL
jgi:hypothetical protein